MWERFETVELREERDRKTYNSIDLARFIAVILVVTIHVSVFGSNATGIFKWLNFGISQYIARLAVPFFFVTSGYFLYRKSLYKDFSFSYTWHYAKKIFRIYLIWTLVYSPIIIRGWTRNPKGIAHAFIGFCRDFLLVGSYYQLWYLNALIFAVLLISLCLKKGMKPKTILIVSGVFYCLGLVGNQSWFGLILPLKSSIPSFWAALKLVKKVIVTTRDGLFDGFIFVSIGMVLAYYKTDISRQKAGAGFVISILLLALEIAILQLADLTSSRDMYLMLVPTTLFGFIYVLNCDLQNSGIDYTNLRHMSSMVFYMHIGILYVISTLQHKIFHLEGTNSLTFVLTLGITLVCCQIFLKLSYKKMKWLQVFYS